MKKNKLLSLVLTLCLMAGLVIGTAATAYADSMTITLTIAPPTAAATASGFTGAYDGDPHGITVTVTKPESGATVKYGTTEGTYDLNASPAITNVADSPLTVYYQVTAEGYDPAAGSATVTISKADQTHPAAPTEESVSATSVTLNAIENGEYSMDGTNWQESPTFTGLTKKTEYTFYQRLVGDANHNASPASPAAVIRTSNHAHSWSYEASGATITATCANTDGGHDGEKTATLTIAAPEHSVFGDGKSAEATVSGSIDGVDTPAIVYKKGADTLTAAPADAGTYTAGITVGGKTASVEYTIAKADITPTVSIEGWTYGETAKTPNVSGNTDNGSVTYAYAVKGSTDFSATVPTNAGDYTVKATVAATNNYNGGEATADFTIAKATVTVTAEAKSKTYDEADPALTYTSSGLVGSDALTGALTREAGENAGTYAIGQGTLTAGDNYTISYTTADFTIAKAAITITADDKSSKYGEDIAELTYQVGGAYKTGDDLGVTVSTTATKTSDVGEYPITVSWTENANYTATLTNGKYTITKTAFSVTASGYSGAYDGKAHGIVVEVDASGATVYYAETELTAENYATAGGTKEITRTDAGTTTVYYYVEGKNYDAVSGSKTIVIEKAEGAAAIAPDSFAYDAESATIPTEDGQEYVIVPKGGTPDWTKAVEGGDEGYVAFENLTPATEYGICTRVKETANTKPGEAVRTALLTGLYGLSVEGEPFVGETLTVSTDPEDIEGLTYQWYYQEIDEQDEGYTQSHRGATIDGADSASYTIPAADYGKTLCVAIFKNGTELESTTVGPVEKQEIEPAVTIEGWAANETAKTPSVTGNTGNGKVTYTYAVKGGTDFSEAVPTTAGDYTVKASIAETDAYYGGEATADFTIQAVYTVKFSTDGGTEIKEQTVLAGNKAAQPADPEKDGNAFAGWYQDATFAVAFDFASPITADVTVYAKWTPTDYQLTSITGTTTDISHTWTKGSGDDMVITVKLNADPDVSFAHFTGVEIDGTALVRDTDYTASEGSTVVTLKAATVEKLSVGAHTVTILFDNGKVDTRLTVKEAAAKPDTTTKPEATTKPDAAKPGSPRTGDESSVGLWLAVMALCGFGIGGVVITHKKRRANSKH